MTFYHTLFDRGCGCTCQEEGVEVFADATAEQGKTPSSQGNLGFRYYAYDVLVGADYHFTNCLVAGGSFGYLQGRADVREDAGQIALYDLIPSLFASFSKEHFFVNGALSYHFYNFHEINRTLQFVHGKAKASTDAHGPELDLSGGYFFFVGNWTTGPLASLDYQFLDVANYKESGGGSLNLQMPRQHQNSLLSKIAGRLSTKSPPFV